MCCKIPSQSWHRLNNDFLAKHYSGYHLLYPGDQYSSTLSDNPKPNLHTDKFLLLDATWQESRKILRQSKWLNTLPKYAISQAPSHYQLRRNQTPEGLSTIESMAHCLFALNQTIQGQELINFFNAYQQAFLTARQAGLLT